MQQPLCGELVPWSSVRPPQRVGQVGSCADRYKTQAVGELQDQ